MPRRLAPERGFGTRAAAVLAAVLLALAFGATHARAADPDLGGEWHLDEPNNVGGAADSSGKGNDLQVTQTDVQSIPDGRFASAFRFGQNTGVGYLNRHGDPALEPQRLTVMAWVRAAGSPGQNRYLVAEGMDAGCTHSSYALETDANAGLAFYVWGGGASVTRSDDAGVGIWDGQWHAVAGTYDGSNVHLYVDGAEVGNPVPAPASISYGQFIDDFGIGSAPNCTNTFNYTGDLDEVRVYDRALSATEVHQLQTATGPAPPELQGGGGSGGGGGAPPPPPPVAHFSLAKAVVLRGGMWLHATPVVSAEAGIVSYDWDTNNDGKFDWHCGRNLAAMSVVFAKPGSHTVGLRVTDTLGRTSITKQTFTTPRFAVKKVRIPTNVVDCENPAAGNQPDRADCVKSFGFGIVDANSRGETGDCFQIQGHIRQSALQFVGPRVVAGFKRNPFLTYTATLNGPVALNGLFVPVPESVKTTWDTSDFSVGLGHLDLDIGPFTSDRINLNQKIVPDSKGRYHLGDVKLPKVKLFGGLALQGGVSVDLTKAASTIKIHVGLPTIFSFQSGETAQGDVVLHGDNENGVILDGAKIGPLDVWMGPILIQKLQFKFLQSKNEWSGGASVWLPGAAIGLDAAPPPPDLGFGLRNGHFDHAGLQVDFHPPAQPELFPGLVLTHVGGAFGIDPIRITGTIGISAANVVDEDGVLFAAFASPDQTYEVPEDPGGQLAPLAGRTLDAFALAVGGTASVHVPVLGKVSLLNGYALYEFPDYFEFAGGFSFSVPFISIDGGVKGFAAVTDGRFNLEGGVNACLANWEVLGFEIHPCFGTDAIVSSKGIGFCGTVPIPAPIVGVVPVEITIGYRWGDSLPGVSVFSCDFGDYRESPRGSQAGRTTFHLPSGLPAAMVRLTGRGAAPDVTLSGPGGKKISTSSPPQDQNVMVIHLREGDETLIALKKPAAGTWTVTPEAGSTPLTGVANAQALAAPHIKARVTRRGSRRVLSYSLNAVPGREVTFVEQGTRTYRILGAAHGSHGRIAFAPAAGDPGTRKIVAQVSQNGAPSRNVAVTTYKAPRRRLVRPRRLRVVRHGQQLAISWARVPGAVRYSVIVSQSDGGRRLFVTRKPRVKVAARLSGTVRVGAVAADATRGPTSRTRFRASRRRH